MGNKIHKFLTLFIAGGTLYISIEIIWRYFRRSPHTHWTMFLLGGLVFVLIGSVNEHISWDIPFWIQVIVGTAVAFIAEFVFGIILNIWLGLNIWDYSNMPLNILGQVCLPFTIAWSLLVSIAIVLDDYLRYLLFGEEKPHYKLK